MNYKLVNENFYSNYGYELLKSRGITDIYGYLHPSKEHLQDCADLDYINEGTALLHEVINSNKPIVTITDSDTDGYCSCAILYQYIKKINKDIQIDVLFHEGKQHGLADKVQEILDSRTEYGLCLVADAGSNDYEYVETLKTIGLPVLIIDHHILENQVSDNCIIINNQPSEKYQNKALCGGGMAYQFCRYFDRTYGYYYSENFIDLAALAEIGDMMDIRELENRYIINEGLRNIKNQFFLDIIDKQSFSMGGKVNPMTVAFYIVPLINAMIRVGTQAEKERLFWAIVNGRMKVECHKRGANGTLEFASIESIRECTNAKSRQNRLLDQITEKINIKIIENNLLEHKILFIRLDDDDDFPSELNGLVAMRCAATYKKPTIVARQNHEGEIKGSLRGISNCALSDFRGFLLDSGYFEWASGHANAAGCDIKASNLKAFHEYADKELEDIDFGEGIYDVNFVRLAAEHDLASLIMDLGIYEDLWGTNNPEPMVYISDLNFNKTEYKVIGKSLDTLKIEKFGITYIKFHAKDLIQKLQQYNNIKMNIVGKPNVNNWNGFETPQIIIEDCDILDDTYGF